jgi:alanyl-tRNA synthetase
MLGNFSFGDYFKREAINWSLGISDEGVGTRSDAPLPLRLSRRRRGLRYLAQGDRRAEDHLVRLGKEDNFWEHGSGPCGPCSEIYYDRGERYGCGKPTCGPGCDCDRYMEVWNNVFSQFNNDGEGHYTELTQKNIDTGMGLERLAVVCQDVDASSTSTPS